MTPGIRFQSKPSCCQPLVAESLSAPVQQSISANCRVPDSDHINSLPNNVQPPINNGNVHGHGRPVTATLNRDTTIAHCYIPCGSGSGRKPFSIRSFAALRSSAFETLGIYSGASFSTPEFEIKRR